MIPRTEVVAWGRHVGWPTDEQVEQDLLLSRLIVEISNDPYMGNELVFRGGSCLHKLHTDRPYRYSEDLDYVRRTGGGIATLTRALTALGERLGMDVRTQIGPQPKVYLRAPFESGSGVMRVKVEMNTFERSPCRDLIQITHRVESDWFNGSAQVVTFSPAELVSTKLRALFQRSKGRDLFDLCLALVHLGIPPNDLVDCFGPYRPDGYTRRRAEQNLRNKLTDLAFRDDLRPLVAVWPDDYDIDSAADLLPPRPSHQRGLPIALTGVLLARLSDDPAVRAARRVTDTVVDRTLRRWRDLSLAECRRLIVDDAASVWPTRDGMTVAGVDYRPSTPTHATVAHRHAVARVRAHDEGEFPAIVWICERDLREGAGGRPRRRRPRLRPSLPAADPGHHRLRSWG